MVALVGQELAESRNRKGQTINADGGAGCLGDFPSSVKLQLLNIQAGVRDTKAHVHYCILFHGEHLVDLETDLGRSQTGYARTGGAAAEVFEGGGVVFTDLVATNRQLELAGNLKYGNRSGPSQRQLTRREWEAIERPLCFLVPEKAADRSGPVCTLHHDHVLGGSTGPQTLCSLHSLNPGAANHIALVAASGDSSGSDSSGSDSSDSDEDEDDEDEDDEEDDDEAAS